MPHSKCFFDSIDSSYSSIVKISEEINPYSRASCGKAGVAIMYRKCINDCISEIENISSDRVLGIELNPGEIVSTFIFCVYLPADGNIQRYTEVLTELQTLVSYYVTQGNIVIAGDLNAQYISQSPTPSNIKSKHLTDFINNNSLVPVNTSNLCSGPKYSFIPSRSMIDHFLIDATTAASCYSCQVIDESRLTLTSDHYPILLKLELESQPTQQAVTLNSNTKCIQWHKATSVTLETYSEVLTSKMEQSSLEGLNLNVNGFADRITECIHEAAYDALPLKRFNKYSKPYWTRDVKLAHDISRSCRRDWLAAGKPRGGQHQSYANYKSAKNAFRKIQRLESNKYIDKVFSDLDEAAELDYRLFWRLLRNFKNKPNQSCIKLNFDGKEYRSPHDVANGFSKYFESILSDLQ